MDRDPLGRIVLPDGAILLGAGRCSRARMSRSCYRSRSTLEAALAWPRDLPTTHDKELAGGGHVVDLGKLRARQARASAREIERAQQELGDG